MASQRTGSDGLQATPPLFLMQLPDILPIARKAAAKVSKYTFIRQCHCLQAAEPGAPGEDGAAEARQ